MLPPVRNYPLFTKFIELCSSRDSPGSDFSFDGHRTSLKRQLKLHVRFVGAHQTAILRAEISFHPWRQVSSTGTCDYEERNFRETEREREKSDSSRKQSRGLILRDCSYFRWVYSCDCRSHPCTFLRTDTFVCRQWCTYNTRVPWRKTSYHYKIDERNKKWKLWDIEYYVHHVIFVWRIVRSFGKLVVKFL